MIVQVLTLGYSRVSLDGENWVNLGELGHINYAGFDIDLSKADSCIKAFTSFDLSLDDEYLITDENFIMNIYNNTELENFIKYIYKCICKIRK